METQLASRNYTPEAMEKILKRHRQSAPTQTVRSLNVEFNTNENLSFDGFNYIYGLFRAYNKNGVLPFEGCLADQPAKIIEIFDVLEELTLEKENKQLQEHNKKQKQQARRK